MTVIQESYWRLLEVDLFQTVLQSYYYGSHHVSYIIAWLIVEFMIVDEFHLEL